MCWDLRAQILYARPSCCTHTHSLFAGESRETHGQCLLQMRERNLVFFVWCLLYNFSFTLRFKPEHKSGYGLSPAAFVRFFFYCSIYTSLYSFYLLLLTAHASSSSPILYFCVYRWNGVFWCNSFYFIV